MKKLLNIIIIGCLLAFNGNAQDIGLKIGEQIPDFVIPKLVNSSNKTAKLSDYRDQLLIVDFWNTGCPSCIYALPKMEKLQKQFGDKIRILPVTFEKQGYIEEFWKSNKYTKNLTIPSVVEDQVFSSYFKHKADPHEIWVYKGKVVAITSSDYVDAANIEKVLAGEVINWPLKNDFYVFDYKKPLFTIDSNQVDPKNTAIKYAAISDYKEGVNSVSFGKAGIEKDPVKKTVRAYFVNFPVYNAYLISWNKIKKPSRIPQPNEIAWEVVDKSNYIIDAATKYQSEWLRRNAICFESLDLDTNQTEAEIYKAIISDLDGLLGLKVRWEKRKEKALVLVGTVVQNKLVKAESLPAEQRTIISSIAWMINQQPLNPYVFDETNYKGEGVMKLNITDWTNIPAIRNAIAPYGLGLKEEERLVDKFVFSEVNGGLLVDAKAMAGMKSRREAQKDLKDPTTEEGKIFLESNKTKPGVATLPSGLQYKEIKQGIGGKPKLNDKVSIRYTGMLVNGKIFDSTDERGGIPWEFRIKEDEEYYRGLMEALQLMPVGSKWILYLPAELAVGTHTHFLLGRVPQNSAVVLELELVGLVK